MYLVSQGLLEAVNESLKIYGSDSAKLMRITTDGESANTGRNAGLWKLYFGHSVTYISQVPLRKYK